MIKTFLAAAVLSFAVSFSSAASASISVSSPVSGSTVASPVQFSATSSNATAIYIYVDYQAVYKTYTNQLNTSLAMSAGHHHITVQSWDSAGNVSKNSYWITVSSTTSTTSTNTTTTTPPTTTTSSTSTSSTPASSTTASSIPSYAKVYNNLNQMSGWQSCDTCSGGGSVNYSKTASTNPPDSTQFFIGNGAAWAQALWWLRIGNNSSISHFVLELDEMMQVPSASFGIEYNVNQVINGGWYKFSTQCSLGWGIWQVWDAANRGWVKTTAPCTAPQPLTWSHVRLEYARANGQTHFVSITVDGNTYAVNKAFYPQPTSYTNGDFGVHFQLNGNADMVPYSVWVKNMTLSTW